MTIKDKLLKLDSEYFGDDEYDNYPTKYITTKNLCYKLATYCYDSDFNLDYDSFEILEKIKKIFGVKVRDKVLYNLFNRNHDT